MGAPSPPVVKVLPKTREAATSRLTARPGAGSLQFLNYNGALACTKIKACLSDNRICAECPGVREAPGAVVGLGTLGAFLLEDSNE